MSTEQAVDVQVRRSDYAQELYITARPQPRADTTGRESFDKLSATKLFEQVACVLREHNAFILQERVFAQAEAVPGLRAARADAFGMGRAPRGKNAKKNGRHGSGALAKKCEKGDLADGIEPTWLAVPASDLCNKGGIAGVQVHAISGCPRPQVLFDQEIGGEPCGRLVTIPTQEGSQRYLTGCNLQAGVFGMARRHGSRGHASSQGETIAMHEESPADQAKAMLAKAEAILAQAGGTLANVARTWMWLGNILDWYGEFNTVRNELFQARGLFKMEGQSTRDIRGLPHSCQKLPASTGIGIGPATVGHSGVDTQPGGRRHCVMDFFAALDASNVQYLLAGGNQGAASKYGSAFSRAVVTKTPGGTAVYVSGTAAIDAAGQTTHLGDAAGQIADTLQNVRAVLKDARCDQDDIVQTMVYCKTPQVQQAFLDLLAGNGKETWPMPRTIVAIADVCRDNLLFEIEATAMPR
jgi:enamine deaminase RidA (YjgF/YER057c/UK114 family)